jgi:hypothetical protein
VFIPLFENYPIIGVKSMRENNPVKTNSFFAGDSGKNNKGI